MKIIIHNCYFDYKGKRLWFVKYVQAKIFMSELSLLDKINYDFTIVNTTDEYEFIPSIRFYK